MSEAGKSTFTPKARTIVSRSDRAFYISEKEDGTLGGTEPMTVSEYVVATLDKVKELGIQKGERGVANNRASVMYRVAHGKLKSKTVHNMITVWEESGPRP
jgi:hypothetical protein